MWKYFCLSLLLNLKMKECQEVFSFELWWYMNSEQTRKQIHGCQIWSFPLKESLIYYNDKLNQITIFKVNTRNSNNIFYVSLFLYHFSITNFYFFSLAYVHQHIFPNKIELRIQWKCILNCGLFNYWPKIIICFATLTRVIEWRLKVIQNTRCCLFIQIV